MSSTRAARTIATLALAGAFLSSLASIARKRYPGSRSNEEPPKRESTKDGEREPEAKKLDEDSIRKCVPTTDGTYVRYDFVKGKDGLSYMLNSDEPDPRGWIDALSDIRTSLLPVLNEVDVAPDGTVSDPDDERLTETEHSRLRAILSDEVFSGVNSASHRDVGSAAVTTCGGKGVYVTSKDYYHPRNWRQQNVLYVLHELAHVACGNPPQERAHNLEFYRVLRILTKAAESLGKKVYDPDWFAWEVEPNENRIGAWIGTRGWYEFAKKKLLGGFRWRDRELERGKDWPPVGTGSNVGII